MEVYKNDYTKQEDELLWELHNIRHKLHKEWSKRSVKDRNESINKLFKKRKQEWIEKSKASLV